VSRTSRQQTCSAKSSCQTAAPNCQQSVLVLKVPIRYVTHLWLRGNKLCGRNMQMVKEAGGLNIADEVQTGFGRTGTHYWGFQNQVLLRRPVIDISRRLDDSPDPRYTPLLLSISR
jgi:hypothetical protein